MQTLTLRYIHQILKNFENVFIIFSQSLATTYNYVYENYQLTSSVAITV